MDDGDARVITGERIVYDVDGGDDAAEGLDAHEGVAQEEGTGDEELDGVFGHDAGEVEVGIQDPGLGETGCPDVDADPAQGGGLVVAVDPLEDVGLAGHQDPHCSGEDDDVADGVVVAEDVDSDAGEVLLAGVAAGVDVLPQEGVPDVGLVAAAYEDAAGGEMGDVTIVDGDPQGIDNGDAAAPEVGVDGEVLEDDALVG